MNSIFLIVRNVTNNSPAISFGQFALPRDFNNKNLQKRSRMNVIFFLILLSLLVAVGFLAAFFWAVRSGQYDDEYTPSVRMLFDDQTKENNQL